MCSDLGSYGFRVVSAGRRLAIGEHEQPGPPVQRLSDVSVPAIVIQGDLEYPMVATCSDQIAARIPGCRKIVVLGADHLLPLRVPESLAELITSAQGS
jgi:3-oxoadipate enol-lactonase